jgi:hypothetical protein
VRGDGWFEPDRIRRGLEREGIEVGGEEVLVADGLPYGVSVEVGANSVALHRKGFVGAASEARAAELRALGLGRDAAIWVYVPRGSPLLTGFPLAVPFESLTLAVDFRDGLRARLTLPFADPAQAAAIARELQAHLRQEVRDLELEEGKALTLLRQTLDRGVKVEAKDGEIRVEMVVKSVTAEQLIEWGRYYGVK